MRRIWRYGPLLLWLAFIWFASTAQLSAMQTSSVLRPFLLWMFPGLTEAQLTTIHIFTRKTAHFLEYAILGVLAWRAFVTSSRDLISRRWFELGLLLVLGWALLDEFHQSFVPSRTGSLYDSAIDVAGGLCSLLALKLFWKRRTHDNAEVS